MVKRKINTNITIDCDIYDEIMGESENFGCNFSKTANHFMKVGLDLEYKKALEEVCTPKDWNFFPLIFFLIKMVDKKIDFEGKTFNLTSRHPSDKGKTTIKDCVFIGVESRDDSGALVFKWARMDKKYREILGSFEVASAWK